jgi:transposase-like protein
MEQLREARRRYGYHEKRSIIEEHLNSGLSLSLLSRKYQIHPVTLYTWKRNLVMNEDTPSQKPNIESILAENNRLKTENKHLKKSVANLSIDNSILTDAVEILKKKSLERALLKQQKKS